MEDEIIPLYCLRDDLLTIQLHQKKPNQYMSDAEVITSAGVSALYFSFRSVKFAGFCMCAGIFC